MLDVAIALALCGLGVFLMLGDIDAEHATAAAVPVFLLVTAPVLWRRAAPLAACGAILAGLVIHIAAFGTITRCGVVFPVVFVLAYASGAYLGRPQTYYALGVAVAIVVVMLGFDRSADLSATSFSVPLTVAVWGIGVMVRSRGRMIGALEVRTEELREARDARAKLEVATDRARLSGELETLLHRRLGELAHLADMGAQRADASSATATLVDIERESRRTLEDMRAIVGVLRHDQLDPITAPQPTLTHLEALLVRAKGADAHLVVEGSPRALPAGVELSAYRVVEQLLEILDDAPGVEVAVRFADDALEVKVIGPARRGADTRAAIDRARERVALHRGRLDASVRGGRAEALAHIPVLGGV